MNFVLSENNSNEKNDSILSKIIPIVIIVVVALVVFILVFTITNSIFNKKDTKPKQQTNTTQKLDIASQDVKILYRYVTTGTNGIRVDKFVKNSKVDKTSFTDEEKLYFALQYAEVEDFENLGEHNEKEQPLYNIPMSKIKKYMTRFFGNNVKLEEDVSIDYLFSFKINDLSYAHLTYSEEHEGYDAAFSKAPTTEGKLVDEFYTKLVSAYKKPNDGSVYLEEKVIYTDLEENGDKYKLSIYKDYDKNNVIETKNVTKESLENKPIKIEDYLDNASTITYVFKPNQLSQNALYFDSSSIKTK